MKDFKFVLKHFSDPSVGIFGGYNEMELKFDDECLDPDTKNEFENAIKKILEEFCECEVYTNDEFEKYID